MLVCAATDTDTDTQCCGRHRRGIAVFDVVLLCRRHGPGLRLPLIGCTASVSSQLRFF